MRTVVFTSDNHSWLLKGFLHQWQKYAGGRKVEVAGFTDPGFLPNDVPFHSMGEFKDYPVQRWSDGIMNMLRRVPDDHVLLLLEDYWMMRKINWDVVDTALEFMIGYPGVIRMDLAADRMFNTAAKYSFSVDAVDFCYCKNDYSLSFQASIFNRDRLLNVMRPGETPWQAEIDGTGRLNGLSDSVYGTYQWPMNYMIVMNKGKFDSGGAWMWPSRTLSESDWVELSHEGCLAEAVL